MNITSFISKKLLFSSEKITLLSSLTAISIAGVTIGTAILIVVMSVFNGFFVLVRDMMLSYDPDIRIEAATGRKIPVSDSLLMHLQSIPEIKIATPYVQGNALISHQGYQTKVVQVRGIDLNTFYPLSGLPDPVTFGSRDIKMKGGYPGILMGERLMDRMRLSIKDKIELVSANAVQRMMVSPIPGVGQTFDVRGGYVLKPLVDGGIVFIDIPAAQRLFRSQGKWSGIDIKLHDFNRASELAPVLKVHLGENYSLRTWYELHKSVYDVMLIEKWVSFAILLVIVLVAVFNILTSLTMIVLQKQRDIGILQAMGMPSAQVSRIFLLHGLFIGIIGSGIGGAVGVLSVWLQETFGLVSLVGSESFVVEAYPVLLQTTDVIWVVTGSLFLCILAAWYPAIRAAKVDPAAAIRYE